jgi:hypothetical protein
MGEMFPRVSKVFSRDDLNAPTPSFATHDQNFPQAVYRDRLSVSGRLTECFLNFYRSRVQGTSINSNLIENSYGRAALSAFVRLQ